MEENNIKSLIVGAEIRWIKRICNLIMFDLLDKSGNELSLHIECFMKVLKDNKIIVSTNDIYIPGKLYKKRKFKFDKPGASLFDETLNANLKDIKRKIADVQIQNNDMQISLENDIIIKIIPDTTIEGEAYILYTSGKTLFAADNP